MELKNRVIDYRLVKAGEIQPNPKNWRMHPEAQRTAYRAIADSIGFAGALLCREDGDGQLVLIDGHLRQEEHPGAELPTLVTDLSEAEADALLALYDPIGALAETNRDKLEALHRGIETEHAALREQLKEMAAREGIDTGDDPPEDPGPQIDRAEELREKWQTERGQLWVIPSKAGQGEHRILCGDSSDYGNLGLIMRPNISQLEITKTAIITDPPYSFGLSSTMKMGTKSGSWHDMMNNASWFVDRYNQWGKLLKASCIWVFSNWRTLPILMRAAHDAGVGMNSVMVWYKDWIGPGGQLGLRPTYELVCLTVTDEQGIPSRSIEDFFIAEWSSHKPSGHQSEKPVKLLAYLAEITEADINIDPFLGSGTTIVACEQTGRIGYGMEIAPEYVAVSLERLAGLGLEPELT